MPSESAASRATSDAFPAGAGTAGRCGGRPAEPRDKASGYGDWTAEALDTMLRDTPRLGLWLDSSNQAADQTVEEILRRADEALVRAT